MTVRQMDDSYEIYLEDTDLAVKRLRRGKLDAPNFVGNLPIANLLHSPDTVRPDERFPWDECPERGYADWRFPGQGVAYPTCGTFYVVACLEHRPGYARKVKNNCGRAECPTDYRTWLAKATNKIVERITAGLPHPYSKAIHVTLSPPTSQWGRFGEKENYLKMRRKAVTLAKKAGISGGLLVFHPYRGNKKAGWHYAPHFHTLCTGWILDYDKLKPRLGGWLVKNHRTRKNIGGTAYYILSHAGVKPGHNVVSWYGSMAWNKLQKIPEPPAERPTCPVCGGDLHRVIWLGEGDNPMCDLNEGEIDCAWWKYVL